MSEFILLGLCPFLGWLAARFKLVPEAAPATFNAWLIRIALPCVILVQIPKLHFDARMLLPAIGPFVLMFSTMALMAVLARRLNWDRGTQGAMTLCWGLGNTSFVGFPLIVAVVGPAGLGPAVIADQATFFNVVMVSLPVAAYFAGRSANLAEMARRVFSFVPVYALLLSGLMKLSGFVWLPPVEHVLQRLADTLTPIALFSVGFQLRLGEVRRFLPLFGIGAAWKMITLPALMWGGAIVMGLHGLPITVGILQIAMAPMITAGIIAEDHGLNPPLANALVSVGIALSFITVPIWYWLIGV
ncbi:AEC family transporter [Hydrocarboniphaga sp.]|uniref:AEC family transporter n=1 Tax=Hydrocarboniphaga sp. TaxID=2033016 RepID=UPI003D12526C